MTEYGQGQYRGEGQYGDSGQYRDEGQYRDQGRYGDQGQYRDQGQYGQQGQYRDQGPYGQQGQYGQQGGYPGEAPAGRGGPAFYGSSGAGGAPRGYQPSGAGSAPSSSRQRVSTTRLPRSRGAASGVLLLLLGAWGALAPFIGPYFNFEYLSDQTWRWTTGRLWLEVVPGAATAFAGLLLLFSAHRAVTLFGAWLGMLAGAWFVVGPQIQDRYNIGLVGTPQASTRLVQLLETLAFFYALGVVIVALSGTAFGRLSVVSLRDLRAAEDRARRQEAARREADAREAQWREAQRRERFEQEQREREEAQRREAYAGGSSGAPTTQFGRPDYGGEGRYDTGPGASEQTRAMPPVADEQRSPYGGQPYGSPYQGHHSAGAGEEDSGSGGTARSSGREEQFETREFERPAGGATASESPGAESGYTPAESAPQGSAGETSGATESGAPASGTTQSGEQSEPPPRGTS
jgi:hypothetical protein